MSRRPIRLLVEDMLGRIERIERFIANLDRGAFLRDEKTCDSVVRNLEVIGEAASRLPIEYRERHADIPWAQIVGLRNRVIHGYFDVDLELVWQIVHAELPNLRERLRTLAHAADDDAN